MNIAYLSIGSNVDNRVKNCMVALEELSTFLKVEVVSSFYETEPYGSGNQDDFVNCAVKVSTSLTPEQLLDSLQDIEKSMGRTTKGDNASRIIDLDIIFYNNFVIDVDNLTIPHKLAHLRRFVLEPICEINTEYVHPVFNKTVSQLMDDLNDNLRVEKIGKYF